MDFLQEEANVNHIRLEAGDIPPPASWLFCVGLSQGLDDPVGLGLRGYIWSYAIPGLGSRAWMIPEYPSRMFSLRVCMYSASSGSDMSISIRDALFSIVMPCSKNLLCGVRVKRST